MPLPKKVIFTITPEEMNGRATLTDWLTALLAFGRREESESAVETAMMKPAPQRATLTQTPSPTAQTNLWRKKSSRTRMWRKMRVKVRKSMYAAWYDFSMWIQSSLAPFIVFMVKMRSQRRTLKRTGRKRRSPKMTPPDPDRCTGPALCSCEALPPPFPRRRLWQWV